jgi:hypothetical protein
LVHLDHAAAGHIVNRVDFAFDLFVHSDDAAARLGFLLKSTQDALS